MPDTPDFYEYLPGSDRYSLSDMGELAVRLGSLSTYDRRGEVVWTEDWGHGYSMYSFYLDGTGAAVHLEAGYVDITDYTLKLIAGSTGVHTARLFKFWGGWVGDKLGFETAFFIRGAANYVYLIFDRYKNNVDRQGGIRVKPSNGELSIRNNTGSYTVIDTLGNLALPYNVFHYAKLCCNFETNKYMRLLFNQKSYNLSSYDLYNVACGGDNYYGLYIEVEGRSGYNDTVNISHFILTANEP
jgi:hypothetical protein